MSEENTMLSGDMRHNYNCYAYLNQLTPHLNEEVLKAFPKLDFLLDLKGSSYKEKMAYGNYYSAALSYLEDCIDTVYPSLKREQLKSVDAFIFAIYHNNNHILEDGEWLNRLNQKIRPQHSNAQQLISQHLEDSSPAINEQSPKKTESLINRIYTLFTPNFKPQLDTNIPSIRNHSYTSDLAHTEYRFSTQAQRHQGEVRVSPLFKRWLAISAKRTPATQLINHIYFNNLGLDRDQFDLPGANEKELTRALHQLEGESTLKTVVITLPASQGLMDAEEYKMIIGDLPYSKVFRELFTLANSEHHPSGVVDFKISPKVRTLLFDNESNQAREIKKLLTNSFLSMGLKPGDYLSPAKRQSVWLHFTKFELTRYILNKLKPNSYNFSCKDAIDRGTVSSLYFNLHQSFNFGQPISKDEFERDLDIAAANVKGRGMNFHRRILWNAIDCFVNANYQDLIQDQRKSWLIYWRDMNCPHSRVSHLLHLRLQQYEQQLKKLAKTQINTDGHQLLATAKQLYKQKVNGQRLLLEVISRSSQFLSEKPTMASINAYKNLAQELKVNHPLLQILVGLMLGFLGVILFSFSLVEQAQAKINTGFFVADRDRLRSYMVNIAEKEEANISSGLSPLSPDVNYITI